MEFVDIYDKDGKATGKVVDKDAYILKEGEYLLAVGMWIKDEAGRILLTRRSLTKKWAPGKWENTAGHVQAGETCVHAILRELREETGLSVSEEQLEPLGSAKTGQYFGENYGVRLNVPVEAVRFQKGETCGAKWVTFSEFLEMAQKGELSPSVLEHMESYKESFLNFIGQKGCTAL